MNENVNDLFRNILDLAQQIDGRIYRIDDDAVIELADKLAQEVIHMNNVMRSDFWVFYQP